MSEADDTLGTKPRAEVVPFPFSRVRPKGPPGPAKDLGMGKMAQVLGVARERLSATGAAAATASGRLPARGRVPRVRESQRVSTHRPLRRSFSSGL
jgi:hypothetical protein